MWRLKAEVLTDPCGKPADAAVSGALPTKASIWVLLTQAYLVQRTRYPQHRCLDDRSHSLPCDLGCIHCQMGHVPCVELSAILYQSWWADRSPLRSPSLILFKTARGFLFPSLPTPCHSNIVTIALPVHRTHLLFLDRQHLLLDPAGDDSPCPGKHLVRLGYSLSGLLLVRCRTSHLLRNPAFLVGLPTCKPDVPS